MKKQTGNTSLSAQVSAQIPGQLDEAASDAFSSAASDFDPEDAPVLFNRYRIISLKRTGGFGSVYVCWDMRLQRRVAIKVMPLDQEDALGAQAFSEEDIVASSIEEALKEARASSHLTHPNIVTVHDFVADENCAYLVMEYVDGISLAEILARVENGVLLPDEAAYVMKSLASAVEYAHQKGVLHLDIKPSNVLIDKEGRVLLGDFGMASLASAAGYADARGGTVGYMPPEQIAGDTVDERSDIFSLGVVGYEALTGVTPFAADTAEKSEKLIQKGAKSLGAIDVPLVGMVEDVFARAMAADAGERPISAKEAFAPAVTYLGNPGAGKASLIDLLNQTKEDEEAFDEEPWKQADFLGQRIPWLASFLGRLLNGLVVGFFVWLPLPLFGVNDGLVQTVIALVAFVGACVFAPLGAALGLAGLAVAVLASGISALSVLCALALVLAGGFWLFTCARRSRLATTDLLAAPLFGTPAVAPFIAAYSFAPLRAACTTAFSAILAQFCAAFFASMNTLMQSNHPLVLFSSEQTSLFADMFFRAFANAPFWAALGSFVVSAAFASFLARFKKAGKFRLVSSQFICFLGVLCGLSLQAGLENHTIWAIPALIPSLFGLGFCVVMSVAFVLFGRPVTQKNDGESEQREFSESI